MSRVFAAIALLAGGILAGYDAFILHDHVSDRTLARNVQDTVSDEWPENETLTVESKGHRVTVDGSIFNEEMRDRLGDSALAVPGVHAVLLKAEALAERPMFEIEAMLALPPESLTVRHALTPPGTVEVSGEVPQGTMREQIVKTYASLPGVQKVVARWLETPPLEAASDVERAKTVEAEIREVLKLRNIYFDFNESTIRRDSADAIDGIAGVLTRNRGLAVRVEGHTDSVDTLEYNQGLSERRAASVVDALVAHGLNRRRFTPVGHGETQPVASNATPEGRAENRRIEFYVTGAAASTNGA